MDKISKAIKSAIPRYDIYLAGPWFNQEQLERIQRVELILDEFAKDCGIPLKVFKPRVETLIKDNPSEEDFTDTFKQNCLSIQDSAIVLAITDGKDVGTIFEAGFAYALNKPIIYYAETLGDKPFNLMLAKSCEDIITSETDLKFLIAQINCIRTGFAEKYVRLTNYDGEIE